MNTCICQPCRNVLRSIYGSSHQTHPSPAVKRRSYTRPAFAPKPTLDLKHIRQNPGLYEQNCVDRNYTPYAQNGWKILELHTRLLAQQNEVLALRQRANVLAREIKSGDGQKIRLIEEARTLKEQMSGFEKEEREAQEKMEQLALELPTLSSLSTPTGEHEVLGYINGSAPPEAASSKSHVEIGRELDLLDFEASASTSGWGWYFLKNEGALLEQALVQYALSVARQHGWTIMTPPSLVYSHIATACGFMPRDQNGETQIYNIASQDQAAGDKPNLVLAGTAEIPFAGSQANKTFPASKLPLKVVGPSRCYRAEAGARGVDTRGLYRVHEFTKVEMFAWTGSPPGTETSRFDNDDSEDREDETTTIFNEMLSIQSTILTSLGLHARVLEMPATDLGASAQRKVDIEVFFPSRRAIEGGYGEVTSASICGDYQSRRLGTRVKEDRKGSGGKAGGFPHTVNGTAMAVPRVLAAVLENGYELEGNKGVVRVPEVLRKWLPGDAWVIRRP